MEEQTVSDDILEKWKIEQIELKKKLITEDDVDWKNDSETDFSGLHLIGGLDISYKKDDSNHACICFVVISFPEKKILYQDLKFDHVTVPFVSKFLAFREVGFYIDRIEQLRKIQPDLMPQVIMVDGNGILHSEGFGIASHLGVLTNIPTIGVAKTLFHHDGIENGELHRQQIRDLKVKGDKFPLVGESGVTWGMALRSSTPNSPIQNCKPIYISVGHRIGLETAVNLVHLCCDNKNPEPVRQADILSREFLRDKYTTSLANCSCQCMDGEANTEEQPTEL